MCIVNSLFCRKPSSNKQPFDKLSQGSLYEWFTSNRRLKPKFEDHVEKGSQFISKTQNQGPLALRHDVIFPYLCFVCEDEGCKAITGCCSCAAYYYGLHFDLCSKTFGQIQSYIGMDSTIIKTYLNWSYRQATTATRKLPQGWESQGNLMAYKIAYLVKAYDIPPALIVNTNQTSIYLVYF